MGQSKESKRVVKAERQPQEKAYSDEFYTPMRYLSPLGPLMLDACAGPNQHATINFNYAMGQDGLVLSWIAAVEAHFGMKWEDIPKALVLAGLTRRTR